MKKEINCIECDTFFTVTFRGQATVNVCPFCGAPLCQEDTNEFVDDDDES